MSLTNPGAAQFDGKRVAVVGLGKSGQASLQALTTLTGAIVSAWDADISSLASVAALPLDTAGSHQDPSHLADKVLTWQPDIIVPAPAIAEISPLFSTGVQLCSEIELAWQLRAVDEAGWYAPWLCVTGTNGKTTTVSMTAAILDRAGLGGRAIGNVGNPAVSETSRTDGDAPRAFALELSSFQLRTTHTMSPLASVCLNFADDHLEWHGSRAAYRNAKARIYEHTQQACLYPADDAVVQEMVDEADVIEGARAIGMTPGLPAVGMIGVVDGIVVDRAFGKKRWTEGIELFEIADIAHLAPAGSALPEHILRDAIAAASLARAAGVEPGVIRDALRDFSAGGHRLELVNTVDGVRYVDDSKATNAHAAHASLQAQEDRSVVWIVGGQAKGAQFDELVASQRSKLRSVVVIGVDQEPWRQALDGIDIPVVWIAPDARDPMEQAVKAAQQLAAGWGTVLLAPACASLDQFSSYAQRGELFATAVRGLHG